MRYSLFNRAAFAVAGAIAAAVFTALPANAQAASTPTVFRTDGPPTISTSTTLVIPAPPGGTVQAEVDVQDADLLGVYKSFLRGIGQAGALMPASLPATASAHEQAINTQMRTLLNNADLSQIFATTTHVHMIVYSVPGASLMGMDSPPKPVKGKPVVTHTTPTTPDQTPFYETAFAGEGGHRIVFVNVAPVHVLMTSFGHDGGYAFMVQVPGTVAVLRANGYPDLSKLSALATQAGALAAEAAIPIITARTKTP